MSAQVKRYRLSLRDGVVEDTGQSFFPPTHSQPMVLATDFARVEAERDEIAFLAQDLLDAIDQGDSISGEEMGECITSLRAALQRSGGK